MGGGDVGGGGGGGGGCRRPDSDSSWRDGDGGGGRIRFQTNRRRPGPHGGPPTLISRKSNVEVAGVGRLGGGEEKRGRERVTAVRGDTVAAGRYRGPLV